LQDTNDAGGARVAMVPPVVVAAAATLEFKEFRSFTFEPASKPVSELASQPAD
jgi:hypothetical protein